MGVGGYYGYAQTSVIEGNQKKMTKKFRIVVDGVEYQVEVEEMTGGKTETVSAASRSATPVAPAKPAPQQAPPTPAPKTGKPAAAGKDTVVAPLQGKIWQVPVQAGDSVKAGDILVVIEAMKMENEVVAPHDAVVDEIHVTKGDAVKAGDLLVSLQ